MTSASRPRIRKAFTWRGIVLLLSAVGLFLVAMHFTSNAVLALAFILVSLVANAAISGWSGLKDASARALPAELSPVGGAARIVFAPTGGADSLMIRIGGHEARRDGDQLVAEIPLMTRGVTRFDEAELVASDPLGLFSCRRPMTLTEMPDPIDVIAYPAPDWRRADEGDANSTSGRAGPGRGEIAGLRPYRQGDSTKDIAWRATARHGDMIVREYEARQEQRSRRFDLKANGDFEAALGRVTAGVLNAARAGERVALNTPGENIAPGAGAAHLKRVLTALARA